MELAKRIKYQKLIVFKFKIRLILLFRLENGRIIAYEGQTAKNIYYVLSGKINCVKKFELSDGELFKIAKILNKGDHTIVDLFKQYLKTNLI